MAVYRFRAESRIAAEHVGDFMTVRHRLPGTPEPMLMLPGADGLQIAADRWGNETNPVVILLHGGGQTRHAWKGTG